MNPYPIQNYFIIAVYTPMQAYTFTKEMIYMMKKNGFLENEDIPVKSSNIFEYRWMATKLLRYAFTYNM